MRTPFLFLLILDALSSGAALAQAPAETVPEARAVIERFVTVTKFAEHVAKTSSRRERGTVKFAAFEGKFDSWSAKPDRNKVTIDLGGMGKMLSGCEGDVAWILPEMMGPRLLTGMDSYQARLEAAYDAPLKSSERYESIRNLGRATFAGKECWKLEFLARLLEGLDPEKSRAARLSYEYYEVSNGLLLGVEATIDGEFGTGPSTTTYSDYRDFGGILLAAKKVTSAQGIEMVQITESVEFDTATDAAFALPVEVQKLVGAGAQKSPAAIPPKGG